jgi:hypothetical protein
LRDAHGSWGVSRITMFWGEYSWARTVRQAAPAAYRPARNPSIRAVADC